MSEREVAFNSELPYAEAFDYAFLHILFDLYENRGRERTFAPTAMAGADIVGAERDEVVEAAENAARWMKRHGFAEGSAATGTEGETVWYLCITPMGIAALGKPSPGSQEATLRERALSALNSGAKEIGRTALSALVGEVMAQATLPIGE